MANCAECGFLALRRADGVLIEADKLYRAVGVHETMRAASVPLWDVHPDKILYYYADQPLCFAQIGDLRYEGGSWPEAALMEMLSQPRPECDTPSGFVSWVQGFTPKEHREMLDRQWMREQEESSRRADRQWRVIELLAFILAGAVTATVAALIERGSIF